MKVSFKFSMRVHKVNFTNLTQQNKVLSFKDIHDMDSLNRVAQQWISGQPATGTEIEYGENGYADCDLKKRKVVWNVKNFKGGSSRNLDVVLSYDPEVVIDELQFKQLGPFTIEFDIPNYSASGIKVARMDAKFVDIP